MAMHAVIEILLVSVQSISEVPVPAEDKCVTINHCNGAMMRADASALVWHHTVAATQLAIKVLFQHRLEYACCGADLR